MKKEHTIGELMDFILANKKDKVFLNQTESEIAYQVADGVRNETLFYSTDENDNINGMVLAELRVDQGVLFVTENLAMSLKNLRLFAKMSKERFGSYKLEWLKHGIHKQHNTGKFYKKLAL
jgi:hypothetical protein